MDAAKLELLDASLMRAAEVIGDLQQPTFARYYARFPEARDEFMRLGVADGHPLEAMMIDNCLYCAMTLLERPEEVEILLLNSVAHHIDTLHVAADRYAGLLDAMIDVVAESLPTGAVDERALWSEIRTRLQGMIAHAANSITR